MSIFNRSVAALVAGTGSVLRVVADAFLRALENVAR